MKLGYQDAGRGLYSSLLPLAQRKAAWLYAQFTVSRTVSLRKTLVGLTPIRESDLQSPAMTTIALKLGGLVEFYRSPARIFFDTDWNQRTGLSGAGPTLVAECRACVSGKLSSHSKQWIGSPSKWIASCSSRPVIAT